MPGPRIDNTAQRRRSLPFQKSILTIRPFRQRVGQDCTMLVIEGRAARGGEE